ncbi:MAG TPA: hypothetical protein VD838_15085 [Anaeromyxobacteraceae bacterium]|nr:hypothetical protein [Anaeromyxobacteraceae bacterium]
MTSYPSEKAERWLRALRQALSALPDDERDDLVAEVRSHLADRAARGDADVLAGFAEPEAYAAEFLEERALSGALAQGASWALGSALLSGARTGAILLAVVPLAVLHVVATALVVLAAAKPLFPGHVGVFVGDAGPWVIGAWSGAAETGVRELLGWWAVPVFGLGGALLLWAANRALRAVARRRLARVRGRAARA